MTEAHRPLRIAIIGAGIGGLAAAVALRQRGFEVALYERVAKLEEVGAGLQIGPNGVKVLRALGLEDELMRNAFEPLSIMSITYDEGRLRFRQPLKAVAREKYGAPYMTAHRADLHNLLRRAAGDAPLHLGAHCVGADTVGRTAVARFADGSEVEADVVIAADGIRSAIRAQHFGADAPRFTEMMAWRAIVPMECVPLRVGPGGSVALERGEYFGWIGPDGHVICYPIGVNGDRLNIFGGHYTRDWVEESWSVPSSREELIAAKAGWNEALLDMFRHVEQVFKWGIYDRDPLPQWSRGRVTLARRRRASDHADAGAGRQHGDRGRLCAGAQSRSARRRHRACTRRLRGRTQAAYRLGDAEIARAVRQQPQGPAAALRRSHLAVRQRRRA